MTETLAERAEAKGLRMTGQRRTIAAVLDAADDHPDVEEFIWSKAIEERKARVLQVFAKIAEKRGDQDAEHSQRSDDQNQLR